MENLNEFKKGLWPQIHESNRIPVGGPATLEEIQAMFDKWTEEANKPRPKPRLELPASDYPTLDDEEFRKFVTMKNVIFVGGSVGVNLMQARCKKLGIPVG